MKEEITQAKKKLLLLYDMREQRKAFGYSTEQEDADIALLESQIVDSEIIPTLKDLVASELEAFKSPLALVVTYVPGQELAVTVQHPEDECHPTEWDEDPEEPADEDIPAEDDDQNCPRVRKRKKREYFNVYFGDGHAIEGKNGKTTFFEALRYMSLERASHVDSDFQPCGYPVVTKHKRDLKKCMNDRQTQIDGFWIFHNLSNSGKMAIIREYADKLNIKASVVPANTDSDIVPLVPTNKRALFCFNGNTPKGKNATVLDVVRTWVAAHPHATYSEILAAFPRELQGSYGVIENEAQLQARRDKGQQPQKRYFTDPDETLTSADGIRFAVSSEWGKNFDAFRAHVKDKLGIEIYDVCWE